MLAIYLKLCIIFSCAWACKENQKIFIQNIPKTFLKKMKTSPKKNPTGSDLCNKFY